MRHPLPTWFGRLMATTYLACSIDLLVVAALRQFFGTDLLGGRHPRRDAQRTLLRRTLHADSCQSCRTTTTTTANDEEKEPFACSNAPAPYVQSTTRRGDPESTSKEPWEACSSSMGDAVRKRHPSHHGHVCCGWQPSRSASLLEAPAPVPSMVPSEPASSSPSHMAALARETTWM